MRRIGIIFAAVFLTVVFLTACGSSPSEDAAKALLNACKSCDSAVYGMVMGSDGSQAVTLTDSELYILSRMEYKIISEREYDADHRIVTADLTVIDLMDLLNEAFVYSMAADENDVTFDPECYMLSKLNSGEAKKSAFRAEIPMKLEAGTWVLNTAADLDSLRDAVSGGAYSWWQLYEEIILEKK
ncbi:MAG: hypothetical protein MJ175_03075 [Clostridia bacterium]|nr:hypothetical protein [Clostridia bacterium]